MPALAAVNDTLKIGLEFQLGSNHTGGSRFFMQYSGGPPTETNLNTLATDVSTQFGTDLAQDMSNTLSLKAVNIIDVSPGAGTRGAWTGSVAGTRSGAPLQIDEALVINFKIKTYYRGGRPKIFLPFGVEPDLASGNDTWDSTFATNVGNHWSSFITALEALTGIGCTLVAHVSVAYYDGFASVQNPVTHRWRNIPTPVTGPIDPINIYDHAVYSYVSQQRRRRFTPAA